jgi:uroporphyrinogen III methyltransferase/synthase
LPTILRGAGVEVDVVPVYETVPASEERAHELSALLRAGDVDAILFTSSSTVENLCSLLGPDAKDLLARVVVSSIGPITSAALEARGIVPGVVASTYTVEGLLDALEDHSVRWIT